MNKLRYWGMFSLLSAGLALTLAGCGGGGGGGGSTPTVSLIPMYNDSTARVSTLAGSGAFNVYDNEALKASFKAPTGLTLGSNVLYVTDFAGNAVREIDLSQKVVQTRVGNPLFPIYDTDNRIVSLNNPEGILFDSGYLYVCDTKNNLIRKIACNGWEVSTFVASTKGLLNPTGMVSDGSNFYVADRENQVIKQIAADGTVTAFCGYGKTGSVDATGNKAYFADPYGIAYNAGYLYVTDYDSSTIRKINIASKEVTTLAGSAYTIDPVQDGMKATAHFNHPTGIVYDSKTDSLYVADTGNNLIRQINKDTGAVKTIAGRSAGYNATEAVGAAASFSSPYGIVSDGNGTLYVADKGNNRIRKIQL